MGAHKNVSWDKFPKQSDEVGKRVFVCFHYDTRHMFRGEIVRDDREEPWRMIIKLDDDRYVEAGECMYSRNALSREG